MAKRKTSLHKLGVQPLSQKRKISKSNFPWNSMNNWLIVLVTILPMLFSWHSIDPTITMRYIFLGWFVLLFVLFFFIAQNKPLHFRFPPLIKYVFAFGICYGLWSMVSMYYSINMPTAIYEVSRHLLNIIVLFVIIITVRQEETKVMTLCKTLMITSLIQSSAGILQYYNLDFMVIPGAESARPYGFMGNRNFFGSAQVLLLPFALFVLYKSAKIWKSVSMVAIIGIIVSILISQSRSAWLASIALFTATFILMIFFYRQHKRILIIGSLTGAVCILLVVSIFLFSNKQDAFFNTVKAKALTLVQPGSDSTSGQLRFIIWGKTLKMMHDNPLLGVGPGNWALAIRAYGDEGTTWGEGRTVPSWPHNVYLQMASESGFPGAILYFSMWVLILISGFKTIQNAKLEDRRVLVILMLAGLAAFATDSMFSFPTERMEHSLYIILMGGVVLGSYANISKPAEQRPQSINTWLVIGAIPVIVFNIFLAYKKYNFEKHMQLAKAYRNENRHQEVIDEVEAGKSRFVTLDPKGEPLEIHSSIAYRGLKNYEMALREIYVASTYNPNSSRIYTTMGVIHSDLRQYNKAIDCYLKALTFTPTYRIAIKNLAVAYFESGNYAKCIETLKKLNIDSVLDELIKRAKVKLEEQNN